MSRLNHLVNFILGVGHFVHAADGEVDLFYAVGAGEIARDGVGDQNGLVGDFGLAEGVDALLEGADDGEGNSLI